jgi:cytochrome P450
MGGGLGSQAPEVDKALAATAAATRMIVRLPIPGSAWSRALAGRKLLEDLFRERIPIMRLRGGSDLFAVLCRISADEDSHLTDDDVVNHMIFFLVAGYNPLTFAMATMMRFLAEHPEWQEQCRSESFAVATDEPDRHDLDKLVSLELVMKESLRLVPPLPLIPRWTVRDVELLGYRVPRGTPMLISLYTAQRSPEFWSNPEQFDPERFAAHRREDLAHQYAWMPFGDGAHRCIGERFTSLQAKLALHHALRRFRWKLAADYRPSIKWRGLPSMNKGMPVHLERVG